MKKALRKTLKKKQTKRKALKKRYFTINSTIPKKWKITYSYGK